MTGRSTAYLMACMRAAYTAAASAWVVSWRMIETLRKWHGSFRFCGGVGAWTRKICTAAVVAVLTGSAGVVDPCCCLSADLCCVAWCLWLCLLYGMQQYDSHAWRFLICSYSRCRAVVHRVCSLTEQLPCILHQIWRFVADGVCVAALCMYHLYKWVSCRPVSGSVTRHARLVQQHILGV
jgi:hypothetical protein